MRRKRFIFENCQRSARVAVLLGFITAAGCGAPDNVLEPSEGDAKVDEAKINTPKTKAKISSRQEREKAPQQ